MKIQTIDPYFLEISKTITNQPRYKLLMNYLQHGNVSIYEHNFNVAIKAYKIARKYRLNIDIESLIRGALLHDYYFYDWHNKNKGFRFHGYRHAKKSLNNAMSDYNLNKIEKDIIKKHMFPLNLFSIPKHFESLIVNIADKLCAFSESIFTIKQFIRRFLTWNIIINIE